MKLDEFIKSCRKTDEIKNLLDILQKTTSEVDFLRSLQTALEMRMEEAISIYQAYGDDDVKRRIEGMQNIHDMIQKRLNLEVFS